MIKIDDNKKVWIFSDPHFSHQNLCRGVTKWRTEDGKIPIDQTRNFETLEIMNSTIVNNINNVAEQDDILICLGDWSFGGIEQIFEFYQRLVCKNIYLIFGNHDHHIESNRQNSRDLFLSTSHYKVIKYCNRTFNLMHYPISSWDGLNKGHIHLHGHVHLPNHLKFGKGKKMDVGMDGHPEFRPYNLKTEIIPLMDAREIKSDLLFDHHTDEIKNIVG